MRLTWCLALAFSISVCFAGQQKKTPLEQSGIPIYPGSKKVSIDVSKKAAKNGSHTVYAEYSSTDYYLKIVDFYQKKLGLMAAPILAVPHGVEGKAKNDMLLGKLPDGMMLQMYIGVNGPDKSKIQYYFILPGKS